VSVTRHTGAPRVAVSLTESTYGALAWALLGEEREVTVLTTTGMLFIGGGAALLGALLEGSLAAAQVSEILLALGAAGALGLARNPRR